MKLFTGLIFCSLVLGVNSSLLFLGEAARGRMCQMFEELFIKQIENQRTYFNQLLEKEPSWLPLKGTWDMWRAYSDMREANFKNFNKYFHARGNYDAAQRRPGGAWAAKVISNVREGSQRVTDLCKFGDSCHGVDSRADQAANEWGQSGKDPNHFRPAGLPDKY